MTGAGVPIPDEAVARAFHEAYERLAPSFGYKTREASAVPWEQVPEANRRLMIAVAGEVAPLVVAAAFRAVAAEWRSHAAEVHEQANQAVTAMRDRSYRRTALAWEARADELERRADRLERESAK